MQILVRHINDNSVERFYGEPDQIVHQLLARWPWASQDPRNVHHDSSDLNAVVGRLNRAQNFMVEIEA